VLDAYYKKIGGRPDKPAEKPAEKGAKGPGRKRKSMAEKKETPAATPTETKRRRQSAPKNESKDDVKADVNTPAESEDDEPSNWVPKSQNWDKEVQSVDTIIRDTNDQGLYALLLWTNGKRSRIHIQSCYERCPMKMLKFYEKHL
jgi:chromobox protein 1